MKILLIDAVYQEELRTSVLVDNDLVTFDQEWESVNNAVGNIYLASISRIEPSLQAAFIEYEQGQHGFLPFSEIIPQCINPDQNQGGHKEKQNKANGKRKIQDILDKNTSLVVQLIKEGRGNKVAAFSTKIGLTGFTCVFHPYSNQVNAARSVSAAEERKKLLSIANKLKPECDRGLTLKSGALNTSVEVVIKDYQQLRHQWQLVEKHLRRHSKPGLLKAEYNLVRRSIRAVYENGFDLVVIDGDVAYGQTLDWLKQEHGYVDVNIRPHRIRVPVFTHYKIEEKIELLYNNRVSLPSGGYIVINLTEALVSIDVNSGKMTKETCIEDTAYKANIEAAFEITRQIKLRSLSGLIIIDFIDMMHYRHYRSLEQAVESACKHFNCKMEISSISSLGLMQISRQRTRNNIVESNTLLCDHCCGRGYQVSERSIIAKIVRILRHEHPIYELITIYVEPEIMSLLLNEQREVLRQMEKSLSTHIKVCIDDQLSPGNFRIDKVTASTRDKHEKASDGWLDNWLCGVMDC